MSADGFDGDFDETDWSQPRGSPSGRRGVRRGMGSAGATRGAQGNFVLSPDFQQPMKIVGKDGEIGKKHAALLAAGVDVAAYLRTAPRFNSAAEARAYKKANGIKSTVQRKGAEKLYYVNKPDGKGKDSRTTYLKLTPAQAKNRSSLLDGIGFPSDSANARAIPLAAKQHAFSMGHTKSDPSKQGTRGPRDTSGKMYFQAGAERSDGTRGFVLTTNSDLLAVMAGRRTKKGESTYNGLTTAQLKALPERTDAFRRSNLASSKAKANKGPRKASNLDAAKRKAALGARLCVKSLKNRTIVAEYSDGTTGGAARALANAHGLPGATAKKDGRYTISDAAVIRHIRQAIANGSTKIVKSVAGKKCGRTAVY